MKEGFMQRNKNLLIALGAILVVIILAIMLPRIEVDVEPREVSAGSELPNGVTRFDDGIFTCFLYKDLSYVLKAMAASISCVNNK